MPSSKKGFAGLADLTSDSIAREIKQQHEVEKPPSITTKQSSNVHTDYLKNDGNPSMINKYLLIGLLSFVAIALIVNYVNSYPEVIIPPPPPEDVEEDIILPNEFEWDGGNYQGDYFEEGNLKIPNGNGKWEHFSNESSYEGQWENGDYHGIGTLIEPNKNEYIGEWENGLRNGKGEQQWVDGRYYDGDWINDKRHGFGVWVHPDGRKYTGDWKNGVLHGEGTYEWPNGEKYIGQYQNDEKHGYGIMYYKDGSIYEGEFVDGYREGLGKLLYEDGSYQEGEWARDIYIEKAIWREPTDDSGQVSQQSPWTIPQSPWTTPQSPWTTTQDFIGTLYNNTPMTLDYYMNGTYVARLLSGQSYQLTVPRGAYTFITYDTYGVQATVPYVLIIDGNGWGFRVD